MGVIISLERSLVEHYNVANRQTQFQKWAYHSDHTSCFTFRFTVILITMNNSMVFQSIWYTLHIRFYTQGKTKYDSNKPKRKQKQRGKNCK